MVQIAQRAQRQLGIQPSRKLHHLRRRWHLAKRRQVVSLLFRIFAHGELRTARGSINLEFGIFDEDARMAFRVVLSFQRLLALESMIDQLFEFIDGTVQRFLHRVSVVANA